MGQHLKLQLLMQGALDFSPNPEPDLADQVGEFFGFAQERLPDARFPDAARELCTRMVQIGPSQRITAEGALRHPWLEKTGLTRQGSVKQGKSFDSIPAMRLNAGMKAPAKPVEPPPYEKPAVSPNSRPESRPQEMPMLHERPEAPKLAQSMSPELQLRSVCQTLPVETPLVPPDDRGVTSARAYVENAMAEAEQRIRELHARNSDLTAEVDALRSESSMTSSLLAVREAELQECAEKLAKSEAACTFHEDTSEKRKRALEAKERELSSREQEISRRDAQLAEQQAKLQRLSDELSQCSKRSRRTRCCKWLPQRRNGGQAAMQSSV